MSPSAGPRCGGCSGCPATGSSSCRYACLAVLAGGGGRGHLRCWSWACCECVCVCGGGGLLLVPGNWIVILQSCVLENGPLGGVGVGEGVGIDTMSLSSQYTRVCAQCSAYRFMEVVFAVVHCTPAPPCSCIPIVLLLTFTAPFRAVLCCAVLLCRVSLVAFRGE
jgi:hypothetical protein